MLTRLIRIVKVIRVIKKERKIMNGKLQRDLVAERPQKQFADEKETRRQENYVCMNV